MEVKTGARLDGSDILWLQWRFLTDQFTLVLWLSFSFIVFWMQFAPSLNRKKIVCIHDAEATDLTPIALGAAIQASRHMAHPVQSS